jgi:hypothetical protein
MREMALACLSALAAFASLARSHGDGCFDSMRKPHGGRIRMIWPVHLELLSRRASAMRLRD